MLRLVPRHPAHSRAPVPVRSTAPSSLRFAGAIRPNRFALSALAFWRNLMQLGDEAGINQHEEQ
jgi:hypothetical protein